MRQSPPLAPCAKSSARRRNRGRKSILIRATSCLCEKLGFQMPYTPILATLAYILSPDRRHVLLIHRNRRPDDPHYGKYNGLGGKLDRSEDVVSCVGREIR